ncbi:MAG TPA: hypothetical protein PLD73_03420 [Candidatus Hydrogenedentes bacterium]|jgi:hypothetical protein|nr:hypothetical protein [Candidatus Hydrogenedentota bacterium]
MNFGYLLFMGLLCSTLALWAIVALRDGHSGVNGKSNESPEGRAADEAGTSDSAAEDDGAPIRHDEEQD